MLLPVCKAKNYELLQVVEKTGCNNVVETMIVPSCQRYRTNNVEPE